MKEWIKKMIGKKNKDRDFEKELKIAVLNYKEEAILDKQVIIFVQDTLFNNKYEGQIKEVPTKILSTLYRRAMNNDATVLSNSFFRMMRKDRDRNATKIALILKNKQL